MNTGIVAAVKNLAPIVFYAAWVFLCLFAMSGRNKWGIFFLIALAPLQNVVAKIQVFPLGSQYNDILLICIFIGMAIQSSKEKRQLFGKNSFNVLLVVTFFYTYFCLWNGSLFLNAPLPFNPADDRVREWKNYVTFLFIFWAVFNCLKTTKEIRQLFWVMIGSILLMNYYTLDQIKFSAGLASREKFNGTFVWLGVNEVAAFYATYTLIIGAVFLSVRNKMQKFIFGLVSFTNTYIVLFLFSRGAYAAYFAGVCFFFLFKKRWLLIPLIIVAVSWKSVLPVEVIERIEHTQNQYGQLDSSSENRVIMWEQSLQLFQSSPIIGKGFNIFPYLGFILGDTHNVFIKILAEQGITGLILMLAVLILGIRSGLRLFRKARDGFLKGMGLGFMSCIVAMIVGNFFGDRWTYIPLGLFFWTFLAMVERGNRIVEEENRQRKEGKKEKEEKAEKTTEELVRPRLKMWQVKRGKA